MLAALQKLSGEFKAKSAAHSGDDGQHKTDCTNLQGDIYLNARRAFAARGVTLGPR